MKQWRCVSFDIWDKQQSRETVWVLCSNKNRQTLNCSTMIKKTDSSDYHPLPSSALSHHSNQASHSYAPSSPPWLPSVFASHPPAESPLDFHWVLLGAQLKHPIFSSVYVCYLPASCVSVCVVTVSARESFSCADGRRNWGFQQVSVITSPLCQRGGYRSGRLKSITEFNPRHLPRCQLQACDLVVFQRSRHNWILLKSTGAVASPPFMCKPLKVESTSIVQCRAPTEEVIEVPQRRGGGASQLAFCIKLVYYLNRTDSVPPMAPDGSGRFTDTTLSLSIKVLLIEFNTTVLQTPQQTRVNKQRSAWVLQS